MIRIPDAIYVATAPTKLHRSFERLAAIVRDQFGADPRGSALFIFHNSSRTLLKLLWHDGRGYSILFRRIDRGSFRIPAAVRDGDARLLRDARRTARTAR